MEAAARAAAVSLSFETVLSLSFAARSFSCSLKFSLANFSAMRRACSSFLGFSGGLDLSEGPTSWPAGLSVTVVQREETVRVDGRAGTLSPKSANTPLAWCLEVVELPSSNAEDEPPSSNADSDIFANQLHKVSSF